MCARREFGVEFNQPLRLEGNLVAEVTPCKRRHLKPNQRRMVAVFVEGCWLERLGVAVAQEVELSKRTWEVLEWQPLLVEEDS